MKKSTRALAVLELLLIGGAAWMVAQIKSGAWQTTVDPGEAITTITQIAGSAMGAVAAVLLVAWFVHRRGGD